MICEDCGKRGHMPLTGFDSLHWSNCDKNGMAKSNGPENLSIVCCGGQPEGDLAEHLCRRCRMEKSSIYLT